MSGPVTDAGGSRAAGEAVLARLHDVPGGRELLDLTCQREDVAIVGGAVRDLLEGGSRAPRELDVVVAGDAALLATRLAALLHGEVTLHGRFGTALVRGGGPGGERSRARIDVASRRAESYAAPGALPTVREGTLEEDLRRRDFTVNAIMVGLGGVQRGRVWAVDGALEDLEAGRLRILHDASFVEDPTRVMRLARYRARLGFAVEGRTERLAGEAVAGGALAGISGARLGAELRLALTEADPLAAIDALDGIGVLAAIHPRLRWERPLAVRALAMLGDPSAGHRGGADRPDLLLSAVMMLALTMRADGGTRGEEAAALLDRLEFPAADRDRAVAAAVAVPRLIEDLPRTRSGSELREAVAGAPPEGVAIAGAVMAGGDDDQGPARSAAGAGHDAARRWLWELRDLRLAITGEDLLAAGVPPGPRIGRGLEAALAGRLDGELTGREAQLKAAIEAARG